MAVEKFRNIEEVPAPSGPQGAEGLRAACELSQTCRSLRPWSVVPGVRRYRSIEEAEADRPAPLADLAD